MEKRGREKLIAINKENAELKKKLHKVIESKDDINLKLCQLETNHNILQVWKKYIKTVKIVCL